ncbi:MAG: LysM peptidoglycan-binding domain-containing protein [Desulfovermiculus sp.]|nr:LysM peptidoglycan-binding domain-containing protein [Desulfovermiculus sp.]
MHWTLSWCLLFLLFTGCAHLGSDQPPSGQKKTQSGQASQSASSVSDPAFSLIQKPALQPSDSDADPAQPLEKEVTETPHSESWRASNLSREELQALRAEPEIRFELDIKDTQLIEDYFIYYSKKHHHVFQDWLKRAEQYLPYIRKVFTEKGLPQDLVFLPFAESGFNSLAYSPAGAAGMWQFMPATGRMLGLKFNWWVDERRDPYKSTRAAAEYLQQLYERFGDWYLVLAAYNAGGGNVSRAMRRSGSKDYFNLASSRQLPNETCRYVPKFLAVLKIVRNLEELGFEPLSWDAPEDPGSIQVPAGTNLAALADAVGLKWSKFQALNPSFRRTTAPPDGQPRVYVPKQKLAAAKAFASKSKSVAQKGVHRYRIRAGDSWWRLSRRFNVPLAALKQFNQTSSNTLRPGQWVLIPGHQGGKKWGENVASPGVYTVKSGDTLWGIARSLGVGIQDIDQANPGLSARHLSVGQKIRLPNQVSTRRIASKRANYEVKSGDTLWGIAQKFNLSLSSLVQANGLNKNTPLQVGSQLYIPDMGHAQQVRAKESARKARVHYQVQKGDNIWSIARKFGVSPQQVMEWNRLSSQDIIHPGDTLTIYR